MVRLIDQPTVIEVAGVKPKRIEEFIGMINSNTKEVSIARIHNPPGWVDPGKVFDYSEYVVVFCGMLQVETRQKVYILRTGQAIVIGQGEWVQYSTPSEEGAVYIAVSLPSYTPDTVHWDDSGLHSDEEQTSGW
jgi:mannose-6-phosphate isomerase-like protein (cupin superfamily)